jgi:hypothetical protein
MKKAILKSGMSARGTHNKVDVSTVALAFVTLFIIVYSIYG